MRKTDDIAFYIPNALPREQAHALRASAARFAKRVGMRGVSGHVRGTIVNSPALFLDQACRDRVGDDMIGPCAVLHGDPDMEAAIQRVADGIEAGVGVQKRTNRGEPVKWETVDLTPPPSEPIAPAPFGVVADMTRDPPTLVNGEPSPALEGTGSAAARYVVQQKGPAWATVIDTETGEPVDLPAMRRPEAELWAEKENS